MIIRYELYGDDSMNVYTQASPQVSEKTKTALQVLAGSALLALCAQISIPLQPVPMSLQTLGVFVLSLTLGGKKASLALFLYLFEATIGLPVLAGGAINPLWILGPKAGYLLSFPLAAYVIGTLAKRNKDSSLWQLFSISSGIVIIYTFGMLALSRFVGLKQSFFLGVLPFLPLAGLKILMTGFCCRFFSRFSD